ncbi:DMT family transporter [Deltaproteobacteria bacterium OttesenSCG-928-K17]|nr:DMT family transporter [Deltaproteobacteria bacterium OttesenSCG-928-K17]
MSSKIRALMFLLLAAFIWGCSYPIGKAALEYLNPWAYGGLRFFFGFLSLLPIALKRRRQPAPAAYAGNDSPLLWLWGGMLGGCCLSVGSILQLYGMSLLPASQVGFITTLYVSMVPILAFVIGYIPRALIIIGLLIGIFGLSLLTGGAGGAMGKSAIFVLVANVFWALQVIVTGQFAARVNTWMFSLAQAFTSAVLVLGLSWFCGYLPTWSVFIATLPFSMWGICSVGIAYTCQTIAQRQLSSTSAALVFPLQSVIGAVLGVMLLGETMTQKMVVGAVIIIAGCVVAQLARESVRVTPEHKYWRPIKAVRYAVAVSLAVASVGGLVWAVA